MRPLDSLTAQPLEGTDGASYPFWSPDSRFVGFFVPGKLKKIDILGGPPQTICDASSGRGGTWSREGVIVFASDVYGGLRRVASAGGASVAITELDRSRGQTSQRWPVFLPDGRRYMYWAGNPTASSQETKGIYVGTLDEKGQRFLLQADSDALYAPPGYLLYLREQSLMAHPFDAATLKLKGEAFPVAEDVASPESYRLGRFSASEDGTLVYLTGQSDRSQVLWLNASGQQEGPVGEGAIVGGIRLSPNGQTLAEIVQEPQTKNVDVWLVDLARGVKTRFTFDPAADFDPVWSPDGSRIAWASNAKGHFDLYAKSSTGAGEAEELLVSDADKYFTDWSRDGRFIAFTQLDPKWNNGADIWILPLSGDRKPYPFLATPFNEGTRCSLRMVAGSPTSPTSPARPRSTSRPSRRPAASGRCRREGGSLRRGGPTGRGSTTRRRTDTSWRRPWRPGARRWRSARPATSPRSRWRRPIRARGATRSRRGAIACWFSRRRRARRYRSPS